MLEFGGAGKQMHMRFDEARHDRIAAGIDHPGRRPARLADDCAIADGDDGPVADRDRLGARLAFVHGEDACVGDDEVGVLGMIVSRLAEASIAAERCARAAGTTAWSKTRRCCSRGSSRAAQRRIGEPLNHAL